MYMEDNILRCQIIVCNMFNHLDHWINYGLSNCMRPLSDLIFRFIQLIRLKSFSYYSTEEERPSKIKWISKGILYFTVVSLRRSIFKGIYLHLRILNNYPFSVIHPQFNNQLKYPFWCFINIYCSKKLHLW